MNKPLVQSNFRSLKSLAKKLRKDLTGVRGRKKLGARKAIAPIKGNDFVLLFAHNGVGKTRLSMEFKDLGKKQDKRDTLYFNAFTEDLFDWDNDFDEDRERRIKFKSHSQFFNGLDGIGIESRIRPHLHRHADFNFTINYDDAEISFFREEIVAGKIETLEDIKISRGEENIFIWCFFLAILELASLAEPGDPYYWVKFVYIDDPISSLDEHNTIAVASGLSALLKDFRNNIKIIISTHHGLFFNVLFNELKGKNEQSAKKEEIRKKSYILSRPNKSPSYTLQDTGESPFLNHVASLLELQAAARSGNISQHHFNSLRSILEKTAIFFGRQHISTCFDGNPNKNLYVRFLNIRSHSKYSVFEPAPLSRSEKKMFRDILSTFINLHPFNTTLFPKSLAAAPAP
ncbi:AAA family ATPase [Pseudomonas sp. fls2-241-TYG-175]|uniref:AAA family ATPase n=1 Tax=Pseudomonas sp. fls2-241-TYG-175 TaxID=3040312 RepID=UPI002557416E|nr:AAA family ATPase [Pseudomonas sp. fls2-241-TYG-175]